MCLGGEKLSPEDLEALADEVTGAMADTWGGVVGGVHTLDQLFGLQHGLVDLAGQGGGGGGFGLHDGVWGHRCVRACVRACACVCVRVCVCGTHRIELKPGERYEQHTVYKITSSS